LAGLSAELIEAIAFAGIKENTHMERSASLRILLAISLLCILNCSDRSTSDVDEGESPLPGLFTDQTIIVDGETRCYDYYVPENLEGSLRPLVFLLHGGGSNTDDLTGESGFKAPYSVWMDIADAEKFLIVYPEGTTNPSGELGWNDCRADATTNPTVNDVAFIDTLIDHFSSTFNIDPNRIYATGTSNGGHMSLRLALELSDKITAAAPVVAAMPERNGCSAPDNPVSILFMNGTQDPLLPYNGGEVAPSIGGRGTVLSTQTSIDYWIDVNQTDSIAAIVNFPDIHSGDDSSVERLTYPNGIDGTQVVLYKVSGGGHVEPSIREQYSAIVELYLGKQNHDIEMAQEIWDFFKSKTR
jgi:polyhydroxybutyrate depolymerase